MKKIISFNADVYRALFWLSFLIKLVLFLVWKSGGNLINYSDADYYEWFAKGYFPSASSSWPVFLKAINDVGLFDRIKLTYVLFFIGSICVPLLFSKLVIFSVKSKDLKLYWFSAFLVGLYPSLNYTYLDIFRDSVMVLFFLMSLYSLCVFSERKRIHGLFFFFLFSWFCFTLRGYLGLSLVISFFLTSFFYFSPNFKFKYFFVSHIFLLAGLNYLGALEPFHAYRSDESFSLAGSSLGVNLKDSGLMFLPLYIYSYVAQILGMFFFNAQAVLVFFVESLAVIILLWRQRNLNYYNVGFLGAFLMIFSVVYSSVFVLANDNLGTALRLRIYVYLSILLIYYCHLGVERKKNGTA